MLPQKQENTSSSLITAKANPIHQPHLESFAQYQSCGSDLLSFVWVVTETISLHVSNLNSRALPSMEYEDQ